MRYEGDDIGDKVRLVPFVDDKHLPGLLEIIKAPWVVDDLWGKDHKALLVGLLNKPDTLFFAVEDGDGFLGVINFSDIRPGHDAYMHGYGRRVFPSLAVKALELAIAYAFNVWDVRRVTTVHCDMNKSVTFVCLQAGFKIEGVHPDSCCYGGRFYRAMSFGITRQAWEEKHGSQ